MMPFKNTLLSSLILDMPTQVGRHFLANCESTELFSSEMIANKGDILGFAYFPMDCIIAFGLAKENHLKLGLGLVGYQGMVSESLILGINQSSFHIHVQRSGTALRMSAKNFAGQLSQSEKLKIFFNRYLNRFIENLAQTAVCNRFHLAENRLATLIVKMSELSQSNTIFITQESLAKMLGIRRVSVTKAAVSLQKQALIAYSRGAINILDQHGLKLKCCNCYQLEV